MCYAGEGGRGSVLRMEGLHVSVSSFSFSV